MNEHTANEDALSRYADIHSVFCYSSNRPHMHGFACHSTCPTCGGQRYVPPTEETP